MGEEIKADVIYDLELEGKKAVLVSDDALDMPIKMTYNDGSREAELFYSPQITEKVGAVTYIALLDEEITAECYECSENYIKSEDEAESIIFGDFNADGIINANDALSAVDIWLCKDKAPDDYQILAANINGDSCIDTYDALGISEYFVYNNTDFDIIARSANILCGITH